MAEQSVMVKMRIKESILARIDAAATKAGMNRSQFMIVGALAFATPKLRVVPTLTHAPQPRFADISHPPAAVPLVANMTYSRPAHAQNCACYTCRPPKQKGIIPLTSV